MPIVFALIGSMFIIAAVVVFAAGLLNPDEVMLSDAVGRNIYFDEPYKTETENFQKRIDTAALVLLNIGVLFLIISCLI